MSRYVSKVYLRELIRDDVYPNMKYYILLDKDGEEGSLIWTNHPVQTMSQLQKLCLSDSLGLFDEKGIIINSRTQLCPRGWILSLFRDHRKLDQSDELLEHPSNHDLILTLHFYNGKTAIEIIEVKEDVDITKELNEKNSIPLGSEKGMRARLKSVSNTPFTAIEYFGDGMLEEYFIEAGSAASVIREYVSNGTFSSLVDWVDE